MTSYDLSLFAISPIDGRYSKTKTEHELSNYFSEFGYIKYRVQIEVEYLIHISKYLPECNSFYKKWILVDVRLKEITNIYSIFTPEDALWIKDKEKEIRHDVKAIELYVRKKLEELGLHDILEYVHFGLTSQDINTSGLVLSIQEFVSTKWLKKITSIYYLLNDKVKEWNAIPMLGRTHGQPATPTTTGKEIKIFAYRLQEQLRENISYTFKTKCGGATGNMNAHYVAYPELDWNNILDEFVRTLGLKREKYTTQISNYDNLCGFFHSIQRICSILIDFCRDMWLYISNGYFRQIRKNNNEIGSSTMPHKINPISFENAEGNLYIAIGLSECITRKLPRSRLQRDLTDSTILRNLGVIFGHVLIACDSIQNGMDRILPDKKKICNDLAKHPEVILEGIQTVLRRYKYSNAYEATRSFILKNPKPTVDNIYEFVKTLQLHEDVVSRLLTITPLNYLGNTDLIN